MPPTQSATQTQTPEELLNEQFKKLPESIQNVIVAEQTTTELENIAKEYKLTEEQSGKLEDEVMLVLLGSEDTALLSINLRDSAGFEEKTADAIASRITDSIFKPILTDLEPLQPVPGAAEASIGTETSLPDDTTPTATPGVQPATPPTPKPTEKAVRAPISESYHASMPSHERKTVKGDPYREQF